MSKNDFSHTTITKQRPNDMMHFGKVGVLLGGDSPEREISLTSGDAVLKSLHNSGVQAVAIDPVDGLIQRLQEEQIDVAFIVLHGGAGENGEIQAVLQHMKIPYTGSDFASCALAMDKVRSKCVFQALNIPTPEFAVVETIKEAKEAAQRIGFPVCIKPAGLGSSVGVSKVDKLSAVEKAYQSAAQFKDTILLEKWIEGKDIFVTILDGNVLPAVEVKPEQQFYDYKAKYESSSTVYTCPAKLTDAQTKQLNELSYYAFLALGCKDWGRLDWVMDKQNNFWLLEGNTVPGMTTHSLVPMSAKAVDINFDQLVLSILRLALEVKAPSAPIAVNAAK